MNLNKINKMTKGGPRTGAPAPPPPPPLTKKKNKKNAQRRTPARGASPPPPPCLKKKNILFTTLTTKHRVCVMGIKTDLRILPHRDRVPRFWWWQTSIPSHQDESCQHYVNIRLIYVNMQRFVCGFTSLSKIFHSYADVTITSEGLLILT